ncbi:MAG: hypothetical protein HQ582_09000 [Planctomycetes bacterium]|nr:hypothetical protein [Planctomycetota bacterium]
MKGRRQTLWICGIILGTLLILAILAWRYQLCSAILRQPGNKRGHISWKDLGPTPVVGDHCTPQGMTYAQGHIIFANSWNNTKSRVYQMNPETMEIVATFDMPEEAVHTSGFAFDGQHLWAVDYISNRCYQIDMGPSFQTGQVEVLGSFLTGLGGTSACCLLEHEGTRYLAISDFMRTARTYVVRHEEAMRAGKMEGAVVFSYRNEGFPQGLEWDGRYLYESVNKQGTDIVNQMDVAALARTGSARKATVHQFNAPGGGVEDLAWVEGFLYTSDEKSFRFYRGRVTE